MNCGLRSTRRFSAVGGDSIDCSKNFFASLFLLITSCLCLCSCDGTRKSDGSYDDVRIIPEVVHPILPGATDARRFGREQPPSQDTAQAPPTLEYQLPEGWVEVAPTSMRHINLLIAGDRSAECYLTVIPGGGSLRDNIDRWCKQMEATPPTDEELTALPKVPLLGALSSLFQVDGTYTDSFTGRRVEDARMVVHLLPIGESTLFLKAIGPRSLLTEQSDALSNFTSSIRLERKAAAPEQSPTPSSSLSWQVPEGWTIDPPKPMREVTFVAGEETRCWITVLGGDGGGALANANRWRKELSLDPLEEEQLAQLATEPMLGDDALVIEGVGPYSSMGSTPKENWKMIGLIRILPDRAVFVKMVGPIDEMETARPLMMQLATSLEVVR